MKRIIQPSLLFAGLFPTLFSGGMSAKAQSLSDQMKVRRPNILWISTEDLSPHLGCYGDEIAQTPNLDRLAAVSYTHLLGKSLDIMRRNSRKCKRIFR